MKVKKRNMHRISLLLFLFLIAIQLMPTCSAFNSDEAADAISLAGQDLGSAYSAVADAEKVGVDVTELQAKLSVSGDFLSEANIAFSIGDYENARLLAIESNRGLEGVASDATRLKGEAENTHNDLVFLTVFGSSIGLFLVIVLGSLGWRFLKKWYSRQGSYGKPNSEGTA
jgi:hypothetical protein